MRSRSVLMLASVATILVAIGIGNAFASERWWSDNSGYERSHYVSGTPHSQWTSTINQEIDVNNGDYLNWHNYWQHDYYGGGSVYCKLQWSAASYAGSGGDYKSPSTISYSGTWSHEHDMRSGQVALPDNYWPTALNNNHLYETTGGASYGSDFNTNQKFA